MIILLKQKLNQQCQLYSFEEEFMMAIVIMIVSRVKLYLRVV